MIYIADVFSSLCSLSTFKINGIEADQDDFINLYDHYPSIAERYCCGDMRADIKPATEVVLNKYSITLREYNTIAEDLSEKLSFGSCGLCS